MALWGTVPTVYGSPGLKCLRAKSAEWLFAQTCASNVELPQSMHLCHTDSSELKPAGRLAEWLAEDVFIHLFADPIAELMNYSFFSPLWTTEVKLYIFLIALLLSWFIWQFGAALLAGMEDLSFPYFFGWGYSLWSIVFFTELTSYQRKMMKFGCFWQKGTFFENKHKVWLVIMSMILKDTMKYRGFFPCTKNYSLSNYFRIKNTCSQFEFV